MKKILCLFLLWTTFANASSKNNDVVYINQSSNKCEFDALQTIKNNTWMYSVVESNLSAMGALKINDFDKYECLTKDNLIGGSIVTLLKQDKKSIVGKKLGLILLVDIPNQKISYALFEDGKNTFFSKEITQEEKNKMEQYLLSKDYQDNVNFKSNLTGYDFLMKDKHIEDMKVKEKERKEREVFEKSILTHKWEYNCKVDKFTNARSCFLYNNDLSILILDGKLAVGVGRNHYPQSTINIKIDDNKTLSTSGKVFYSNASYIINQLKTGKIAYTRYQEWPYEYRNIDRESSLDGFSEVFDQMMESYSLLK